jgi:hypothetical protein
MQKNSSGFPNRAFTLDVLNEGEIPFKTYPDGSPYTEFVITGPGGNLYCRYEPEPAAEKLLEFFEGTPLPVDCTSDYQAQFIYGRAHAALWCLLDNMPSMFEIALRGLVQISKAQAFRLDHIYDKQTSAEAGVPAPTGRDIDQLYEVLKTIQEELKNLAETPKQGNQKGSYRYDRLEFRNKVERAIRESASENPTRDEIAAVVGIGPEGIGGDSLKRKLRECGIREKWKEYVRRIKAGS